MRWMGWVLVGFAVGCVPADELVGPEEDPAVHAPCDTPEIAYDGIDQDCDGADLLDADGDGFDADFLRADGLVELASRQDLDTRERLERVAIFLSPRDAAAALRAGNRSVCFLTHAWRSREHPDPDGATFDALLRFLRHPLGAAIVGVFVDFACLHQPPRTPEQEIGFGAALPVTAHHSHLPCTPPHTTSSHLSLYTSMHNSR